MERKSSMALLLFLYKKVNVIDEGQDCRRVQEADFERLRHTSLEV